MPAWSAHGRKDRHAGEVHAVLRSLDSAALLPDTLVTYRPPLPDDFGVLVDLEIGPSQGGGAEIFYVTVCTAKWLGRTALDEDFKGFEFLRHRLLIERWDPSLIRRAVADLCARTDGRDWNEVATRLSRYLAWEFEDYSPRIADQGPGWHIGDRYYGVTLASTPDSTDLELDDLGPGVGRGTVAIASKPDVSKRIYLRLFSEDPLPIELLERFAVEAHRRL